MWLAAQTRSKAWAPVSWRSPVAQKRSGDFLSVVGEDLADGEWRVVDQALEEAAGGGC